MRFSLRRLLLTVALVAVLLAAVRFAGRNYVLFYIDPYDNDCEVYLDEHYLGRGRCGLDAETALRWGIPLSLKQPPSHFYLLPHGMLLMDLPNSAGNPVLIQLRPRRDANPKYRTILANPETGDEVYGIGGWGGGSSTIVLSPDPLDVAPEIANAVVLVDEQIDDLNAKYVLRIRIPDRTRQEAFEEHGGMYVRVLICGRHDTRVEDHDAPLNPLGGESEFEVSVAKRRPDERFLLYFRLEDLKRRRLSYGRWIGVVELPVPRQIREP